MASAVLPGRLGEPMRVVVLSRRSTGSHASVLPVVAGTVFSQTLINLLALADPRGRHVQRVPLLGGHLTGVIDRAGAAAGDLRCWCSPGRACWSLGRALSPLRSGCRPRALRSSVCCARPARPRRVRPPSPRRAGARRCSCSPGRCSGWPATRSCSRWACSTKPGCRPPPRSCSRSTSARSCPRRPPTSASSRPPAWSCSPPTASARAWRSPTASSCRPSRSSPPWRSASRRCSARVSPGATSVRRQRRARTEERAGRAERCEPAEGAQ